MKRSILRSAFAVLAVLAASALPQATADDCFHAHANQRPANDRGMTLNVSAKSAELCSVACSASNNCYAYTLEGEKCELFLNLGDMTVLEREEAKGVKLYVKSEECYDGLNVPETPRIFVGDDGDDSPDSPIHIVPIDPPNTPTKAPYKPTPPPPRPPNVRMNEFEKRIAECCIVDPRSQHVTFEDIVGLKKVKASLHDNVVLPAINAELFDGPLLQPAKGILLFGPPGNGKTFIAKAVAKMAGATFLSIGASSVGSKWHGEGENLMKAVFTLARKIQPVIIFFDEIDGLLKKRGGGDDEHEAVRKIKTEFLAGLDGMASQVGERVLCLGASNRPMDLDDAALRRFPERYMVGMPGKVARRQIVDSLMKDTNIKHNITEADFQWFVEHTEGYSASDITNAMKDAAMAPVDEFAQHILDGDDENYDPKKDDIDTSKLRPVCKQDLANSIEHVKPSVSAAAMKELEAWNDKFGAFAVDNDEDLQSDDVPKPPSGDDKSDKKADNSDHNDDDDNNNGGGDDPKGPKLEHVDPELPEYEDMAPHERYRPKVALQVGGNYKKPVLCWNTASGNMEPCAEVDMEELQRMMNGGKNKGDVQVVRKEDLLINM